VQISDRGSEHLATGTDVVSVRHEVLTFLRHSLRLRTLDALVFCPSVAGGVNSNAGVGVALQRHHVVLTRNLAAELVCNSQHTQLQVCTHIQGC